MKNDTSMRNVKIYSSVLLQICCRSVGGIRASLYNAIREDEVEVLAEYMKWFHKQHSKK